MRPVWLAICAILAVFSSPISGTAYAAELPAEFVSQYAPAAAKLKQAYAHATIHGSYSLAFPRDGNPGVARMLDFVLRVDGARMRLDETNVLHFTDGQRDGASYSRQWLITPARAMSGYSDQLQLELEPTSRQSAESYVNSTTQINWVHGWHLLDFLHQEEISIDSIEDSVRDGRQITIIGCHWQMTDGGKLVRWTARYELSPSEAWALRECVQSSAVNGEESRFSIRIDYEGSRDGVPLVKHVIDQVDSGPNFEFMQRKVTDISDIEFGTPFWPPVVSGVR